MKYKKKALMAMLVMTSGTTATQVYAQQTVTLQQECVYHRVEELWISNGDRRIYGVVSTPDVERKKVAIVSHGFNGIHDFGRNYFDFMGRMGYMVYTFDYPCGSIFSRSDSDTMNMSIIDEKNDLIAIVHHFQQREDVDSDNIVLIGESQGGLVSALAAAELGKEISRLVLVYSAFCIPDNWNSRYKRVSDIPDTTRIWNVPVGRRFFEELHNMKNVYKTACRYEGPVQIVHGSKDSVVPLSYAERAMKMYKNCHLGVIPGAGHGFNDEQRHVSNAFVREFLEEQ